MEFANFLNNISGQIKASTQKNVSYITISFDIKLNQLEVKIKDRNLFLAETKFKRIGILI